MKKMKEIILTILITLLPDSASGDSTNALKFGQTVQDYIIYKPDITPLQNAFSVCSWVRSLKSIGTPSWLSYAVSVSQSGHYNEILISDNGFYNHIFDQDWDLQSKFSIPTGTWYHYCYSWSSSSGIQRVYLNGQLIGSRSTESGRNLGTNGYLVIGNDQDSYGGGMAENNIFGGELYNLNFFSKELSSTEVQEMARDKCAEVEETYGDVRSIKWEEILLKTRNGNITEIRNGCEISPLDKLRATLQQTDGKLNDTLEELERIKEEKEAYEIDLENKGQQLNDTLEELERIKEEKDTCQTDLKNEGQQLNDRRKSIEKLGDKTALLVACTLAGVFFVTTMLISIFAGRKFLKRKCSCTSLDSEPEYIENTITPGPPNPPAQPPPNPPAKTPDDHESLQNSNIKLNDL